MKLKKIVVVPGFICIFANLISLFTFTVSWFANNTEVSATGLQVKCEDPNLLQTSYDIYEYDTTSNSGAKTDSFELGSYDTFIESRNAKLAKIMEITIKPKEGVTYDHAQTLSVEIPCASAYLDDDSKIASSISNIVTFKTARLGYKVNGEYTFDLTGTYDDDAEVIDDDTFYTNAVSFFEDYDSQEFVSDPTDKAVTEVEKSGTLTFTNITAPAYFEEIKIAVEYTYSKTLVDYFYSNYDSKIEIKDLTGNAIAFSDDLEYFLLNLI